MKNITYILVMFMVFWNILQGKIDIETTIVGILICLFVVHFNRKTFLEK